MGASIGRNAVLCGSRCSALRSWWRRTAPLHRTHRRYNDVSVCTSAGWRRLIVITLLLLLLCDVSARPSNGNIYKFCKLNLHSHLLPAAFAVIIIYAFLRLFSVNLNRARTRARSQIRTQIIEWTYIPHANWLHQVSVPVPNERVKRMFVFGVRIRFAHCTCLEWAN